MDHCPTVMPVGAGAAERIHSHFLEEVPVGDDLELLQDEEDPTADKEGLLFGQRLVQQQQVPLAKNKNHKVHL